MYFLKVDYSKMKALYITVDFASNYDHNYRGPIFQLVFSKLIITPTCFKSQNVSEHHKAFKVCKIAKLSFTQIPTDEITKLVKQNMKIHKLSFIDATYLTHEQISKF